MMARYEGHHLYPQNTVLLNKIKRVLLIVEGGADEQINSNSLHNRIFILKLFLQSTNL